MKVDLKEMLERLEKASPDSFQDLTDIIERHTENVEKLNMILDAIPKLIAQRTGENEKEALNIIPDILSCDTPDEVCAVINKWMVETDLTKEEKKWIKAEIECVVRSNRTDKDNDDVVTFDKENFTAKDFVEIEMLSELYRKAIR